eukprot:15048939-Heterocapsa_arctica.AAC.1
MERDVLQDARPQKRRREQSNEMDREEDNDESDMIDYPDGFDVKMEEKNKTWERHIGAPAIFIQQLECYAQARAKTDTYMVECNSG